MIVEYFMFHFLRGCLFYSVLTASGQSVRQKNWRKNNGPSLMHLIYHFWLGVARCVSHPSRLQDSLIINISKRSQLISQIFCMKIFIRGRQHVRLSILARCGWVSLSSSQNISRRNQLMSYIMCMKMVIKGSQDLEISLLVECSQVCLSSDEIAGFFDEQYFWEESVDALDFLHENIHLGKIAYEPVGLTLFVGLAQLFLLFNQIAGFLDHLSRRNQLIPQTFSMVIFITRKQHLRLLLLLGCCQVCPATNQQYSMKDFSNSLFITMKWNCK